MNHLFILLSHNSTKNKTVYNKCLDIHRIERTKGKNNRNKNEIYKIEFRFLGRQLSEHFIFKAPQPIRVWTTWECSCLRDFHSGTGNSCGKTSNTNTTTSFPRGKTKDAGEGGKQFLVQLRNLNSRPTVLSSKLSEWRRMFTVQSTSSIESSSMIQ